MENYRLNKAYNPKTILERISYTVEPPPKTINTPQMSSTDAIIHAAEDLIHALKNSVPATPLVTLEN